MQIRADLAQMQNDDYWKEGGVGWLWWQKVRLPHVFLPHAFVVALAGILLLVHVVGEVDV